MIPIRDLFESHLTVSDLQRSMKFFGETLGLELGTRFFRSERLPSTWIGGPGSSMLGVWEVGTAPQRMSLHVVFKVDLPDLLEAPQRLQAAAVTPRDFSGNQTEEPVVRAWMPAASLYFHDPDGNLLEFLSMLPDSPQPELGIVGWSQWEHRHNLTQTPSRGYWNDSDSNGLPANYPTQAPNCSLQFRKEAPASARPGGRP